jgi:hypothetical protein
MGLLWEGDTLYAMGDGGLRRFRVKNDKADGPSELLRAMKTGGEHAAHAIRRGPDGWLYVLCGNNTGIDRKYATLPTSPIKEPVAGCVLRFNPDLKESEIVADGFRNPYDMDFNPDGELFTYDSDNERCVSLPWYGVAASTTLFPAATTAGDRRRRASSGVCRLPDVVAPVADLGRGRRPAVSAIATRAFREYRGGFFLLDWTFGKIHFLPLKRKGSTYTSTRKCSSRAATTASPDGGSGPPGDGRPVRVDRRPRHARGGLPHPLFAGPTTDRGRGGEAAARAAATRPAARDSRAADGGGRLDPARLRPAGGG